MKAIGKWILAAGLCAAGAAPAALEDDGRSLEAAADATVVTADKLTFDFIKKFALFENNVVVNDPRLQLNANRLTIIFTEEGGAQTIKAEGKVLLTQGDKKARADVAKGSGLGLAVTARIIEAMQGRIWARPAVPKGLCICIWLPTKQAFAQGMETGKVETV